MILDSHGRPLRRAAGFVRAYLPERRTLPLIGALNVVGFEIPLVDEDDEEEDGAAAAAKQMRRA